MINEKMIEAGVKAHRKNWLIRPLTTDMVSAIYQAMTDQKQKDALIAYNDSVERNPIFGHSDR